MVDCNIEFYSEQSILLNICFATFQTDINIWEITGIIKLQLWTFLDTTQKKSSQLSSTLIYKLEEIFRKGWCERADVEDVPIVLGIDLRNMAEFPADVEVLTVDGYLSWIKNIRMQ